MISYPDRPLVPFAKIQDGSGLWNNGWAIYAKFDGNDKTGNPQVCMYNTQEPLKDPWSILDFPNFEE